MILWSVDESQTARTDPLRSVLRWPIALTGCSDGAHCVLPDDCCAACSAAMYAWNCCGVTTFSVNSMRLW